MTKEIEVYGRRVKLYKVRSHENAWCSDPDLALQIERRIAKLYQELNSSLKQTESDEEGSSD